MEDDEPTSTDNEEPTSIVHEDITKRKPLMQLFVFLLSWQAAFKVSTSAIHSILRFLRFFLHALAAAFSCAELNTYANHIPLTRRTLCKSLKIDEKSFRQYVVCSKCNAVYEHNACLIQKANGFYDIKKCCLIQYPCHPQLSRRVECGGNLLNVIQTKQGLVYRPIKVYPYQSLSTSLSRLALRPSFLQCREEWWNRPDFAGHGYMCDIYDGAVWKEFVDSGFLRAPYNYLLTLNIDWFSPFDRSIYSLGAIYLTIQNLPRSIRYKPENIILVGLIPGPSEPKLTVNGFLAPLVEELTMAWNEGIIVTSPEGTRITIRIVLSCVACDIPATRKVCGFLGHRATLGCHKCLKHFEQVQQDGGSWTNYSGYERSSWTLRSDAEFLYDIKNSFTKEKCSTRAATKYIESQLGGRYSVLMDLPYFQPVRYSVIDPMHNLYLGTGKHMMEVWLSTETLTRAKMSALEEKIYNFVVPDGIGRLPSNVSAKFGGFTADQWKNWITIFSPILLRGCIPDENWRCWMLFVKSCSVLASRTLKMSDAIEADSRLLIFCKKCQELYGEKACTINMHLHLHLLQCIKDYGATSGFWLYAFERYNGLLGSFHTNNKSVECQIMKSFLQQQSLQINTDIYDSEFVATLPTHNKSVDTIYPTLSVNIVQLMEIPFGPIEITQNLYESFSNQLRTFPPIKKKFFIAEPSNHCKK